MTGNIVPRPHYLGFKAIKEAWDKALCEYYALRRERDPKFRIPVWRFEIAGWESWYEGKNRKELGVVKPKRRGTIVGAKRCIDNLVHGLDRRPRAASF